MRKKLSIFLLALLCFIQHVFAFTLEKEKWVDSVFMHLNLSEKIGQTIWVQLDEFPDSQKRSELIQLARKGQIGGIIFHEGEDIEVNALIQDIKTLSIYPIQFFVEYQNINETKVSAQESILPTVYLETAPTRTIEDYGKTLSELISTQGFDGLYFSSKVSSSKKIVSFTGQLQKNGLKLVGEGNALPFDAYSSSGNQFTGELQKPKKVYKAYETENQFTTSLLENDEILVAWLNTNTLILDLEEIEQLHSLTYTLNSNKWYRKILNEKSKQSLAWYARKSKIPVTSLKDFYKSEKLKVANYDLRANSITIVKSNGSLPISSYNKKIAILGTTLDDQLISFSSRFAKTKMYSLLENSPEVLLNEISDNDHLIVPVSQENWNDDLKGFVRLLQNELDITFIVSGLEIDIDDLSLYGNVIWAVDANTTNLDLAIQVIFGAISANGAPEFLTASMDGNNHLNSLPVLKHSFPAYVDVDANKLEAIEDIVSESIKSGAFPGCQIAVIKNSHVIYQKSFGYFTYDSLMKVNNNTLYDLASITKVAATLQSIMFLAEQEVINLDDSLSKYLPETIGTNKEHLTLRKILLHEAGLRSYQPFWKVTLEKDFMSSYVYQDAYDSVMDIRTYGLYLPTLREKQEVWQEIIDSELRKLPKDENTYNYLYSDLGFMILQMVVERVTNQPMDEFLAQNVYEPLGLYSMTFNPLLKFDRMSIAPTEYDYHFRNAQVWGTVHDQNASVLGGVAGHAGLFSNALDLAKLMQMNLNGGIYGNYKYIHENTLNGFTSKQHQYSRRGLGWDKPDPIIHNLSERASSNTFGHLGFTGTAVWVDPDADLIYVFLSNRIFPSVRNRKLMEDNIRTRIQDVIYDALGD